MLSAIALPLAQKDINLFLSTKGDRLIDIWHNSYGTGIGPVHAVELSVSPGASYVLTEAVNS